MAGHEGVWISGVAQRSHSYCNELCRLAPTTDKFVRNAFCDTPSNRSQVLLPARTNLYHQRALDFIYLGLGASHSIQVCRFPSFSWIERTGMMHYGSSVIDRIDVGMLHGLVSGPTFSMPKATCVLDRKAAIPIGSFYLVEKSFLNPSPAIAFCSFGVSIRFFRTVHIYYSLLLARR